MTLHSTLIENCSKRTACLKLASLALAGTTLSWNARAADPVKLRFASWTSDTEETLLTVFKPFAEAVNRDSGGAVQIDVFPNGVLGRNLMQQAQMVLDGIADFAWVVPAFTPGRFPETEVFEMPGLFRDLREATTVFSRITAAGKIKSFEKFKFIPIGTVGTDPYTIHTRVPVKSLADLKGLKIRTTSSIEADTLRGLGAVPVGITTVEGVEAAARGTIDGTTMHLSPLFDYGYVRVLQHHYFLGLGTVPVTILMSKAKFDSLPKAGQDAIVKNSGMAIAKLFSDNISAYNAKLMKKLEDDPKHTVVIPSKADKDAAQPIFDSVINAWLTKSPDNKPMLDLVQTEIAAVRAGK